MKKFINQLHLKIVDYYLKALSQAFNINNLLYLYSIFTLISITQIITGVIWAMHYTANGLEAFKFIFDIWCDINNGLLVLLFYSFSLASFFLGYFFGEKSLLKRSYLLPKAYPFLTINLTSMMPTAVTPTAVGTGYIIYKIVLFGAFGLGANMYMNNVWAHISGPITELMLAQLTFLINEWTSTTMNMLNLIDTRLDWNDRDAVWKAYCYMTNYMRSTIGWRDRLLYIVDLVDGQFPVDVLVPLEDATSHYVYYSALLLAQYRRMEQMFNITHSPIGESGLEVIEIL